MWAQMNEEVQLLNGEVWESPLGVRGIAQWIDDDFWVLLSEPKDSGDGGTRMEALQHSEGVYYFTHAELYAWLVRSEWRKCEAHVALLAD
jgi:hypothetical protein